MRRVLLPGLLLLVLGGCQLPPERVPLQPLPENGPPLPYAELLTRVRAQAVAGTEAFYVNRWTDLEDVARGIEQTARYLSRAEEVPAKNKDNLSEISKDLAIEANKLKAAASAKDVKAATDALKNINTKVRELRLTD